MERNDRDSTIGGKASDAVHSAWRRAVFFHGLVARPAGHVGSHGSVAAR